MTNEKRQRRKTLFALAFANFIDQGETQVMAVLFPVIQRLWQLDYASLGLMSTIRNLLQIVSAPLWGYVTDRYPRKMVLALGSGIWGFWTLACGLTQTYPQLLVMRALSGIGLGCFGATSFSLLADTFPPARRGRAVGQLGAVGVVGLVAGILGVGIFATPSLWRWGFILLGVASILSGVLIALLIDEPPRGASDSKGNACTPPIQVDDIPQVLTIRTVWVAILQGLTGNIPWAILSTYFIAWLVRERGMVETLSLTAPQGSATLTSAALILGSAISNIIGGYLSDWAAQRSFYGRIIVAQASIFAVTGFSYVLFTYTATWSFGALFLFCLAMALVASWSRPTRDPLVQATVPAHLRGTAYALITIFESGLAILSVYIAGWLADRIGLGRAILWLVPVPWLLCGLVTSLFYWAYPRDMGQERNPAL